jgi:hypothetical protein
MTPNLFICMALVAVGILFHFVLKLSELETQGKLQTPLGYWREHPYTSLVVVMAAYLFMALQAALGELSYSAAILTGIACNSLGDKLRARAQALK